MGRIPIIKPEELKKIKVGYTLERAVGGALPMDVIVGKIDDKLIYCGTGDDFVSYNEGWKFLLKDGKEIDDDLGWDGVSTTTGNYLTRIVAETDIKVSDRKKPKGPEELSRLKENPDAATGGSGSKSAPEEDALDPAEEWEKAKSKVVKELAAEIKAKNPDSSEDEVTSGKDPGDLKLALDDMNITFSAEEAAELLKHLEEMNTKDSSSSKSSSSKPSTDPKSSDTINKYNIKFATTGGNHPSVKRGGMTVGSNTHWISIDGSDWKKLVVFNPHEMRQILPICKKEIQVGHIVATATGLHMTMLNGKFIFIEDPDDKRLVDNRVAERA